MNKQKSYNVEIFNRVEYTRDRYTVHASTRTEAGYMFCRYILAHTDLTFADFEIIRIEERKWENLSR